MSNSRNAISFAAMFLLAGCMLTLPGCGSSDGRLAISGEVSVDGSVVDKGTIRFVPIGATQSPSTAGAVTNGNFSIPAAQGVFPGKFEVTFQMPLQQGKSVNDVPEDKTKFDLGAAVRRAQQNAPKAPKSWTSEISIDAESGRYKIEFESQAE